jgi:dTDP-L-rhamnose 4-epimerase
LHGERRSADQLESRTWDLWTRQGDILLPIPTPESKPPDAASVDALSKFTQEQMCLLTSRACDIPTVALRLFNVYGTRLALSRGYTCVLAEFASRLLLDRSPVIFEDGYQQRDFVSVHDVVSACRLALETPRAVGHFLNIGSGSHFTIRELAVRLANVLGKQHIELKITQKHRFGDIRHCFADIRLARELLGFEPRVTLDQGLAELGEWLSGQNVESHPTAVPPAEMRAGMA